MISLIKKHWCILLLIFISFVSHWYIFFDLNILNSGDWVYYFNSQAQTTLGFALYNSSVNLGSVSVFANNWIFYILFYMVSHFGLSWDIFTRLFFLIPSVFLTPLFSFLLFKKIFKSDLIAFFSACVYSFNTFFLKLQLDWLTYAFIWWVLPALFLSILNYLETKRNKYLVYNALLVFLGLVFELRIMILVLVFLAFYQLIFLITFHEQIKEKMKSSFYILLSIILGILGHAYWLVPLKFSNIFGDVMSYASLNPFASFYDIVDAFTLHMYSWSHNLVLEPFIRQPIEFRHFLIPIFSILGLVFFNRHKHIIRKDVYIFFLLSLVAFIFLGKQELKPFQNIYGWLFRNLPLFNLYRESGKFFILIALPLSFFFGLGLHYVYSLVCRYRKDLAIVFSILILFFTSIYNLEHFFDQKIGGMVKEVEISSDYLTLEKKLSSDKNYYRILWMPVKSRFGFYSEDHPFISAINLTTTLNKLSRLDPTYKGLPIYSQLLFLLQQNYSQSLLNNMAVKYIILPVSTSRIKKISINRAEVVTEIYEDYGKRGYFIKELDKISWLKKINIGTKELAIYENKDYRPHIYATGERETIYKVVPYEKVAFKFKNPTKYLANFKGVSQPLYLNFSEAFHPNWKVRAGRFNWFKVLTDKSYFISDKNHFENDAKLNSFYIDPNILCSGLDPRLPFDFAQGKHGDDKSQDGCKINPDGSYDMELTLYFAPQSYMYLGLIISGATLLACLGYLAWEGIKRWM